MNVNLDELLLITIYTCLIILIIIFIVLGIKLIKTLKKLDIDVNEKMGKVNGVFDIIDKTTDYACTISDKIITVISNFINGLIKKVKGKDNNE